jgi:hypothetical protein
MHRGQTLRLDLPEPAFTDQQLRDAHAFLGIKQSFEWALGTLWGPTLLKCVARELSRKAVRQRR